VEGFTFRRGKTTQSGGGLYIENRADAVAAGPITVKNCVFADNFAELGGGGASVSATSHSGTAGDIVFANDTVTGNIANGSTGGVYVGSNAYGGASGARSPSPITPFLKTLPGTTMGESAFGE